MASKILKNNTLAPIVIVDVGNITVPVLPATYTIPAEDYLIWAESDDIITELGASNITVNDGNIDLSIARGTSYIQFGTQQFLVKTPKNENVSLTTVNTEVSHSFPVGTKRYIIQNRDDGLLKLAFAVGESGTNYKTIWPGAVYSEDQILGGTTTIYLQSTSSNQTVETISWI